MSGEWSPENEGLLVELVGAIEESGRTVVSLVPVGSAESLGGFRPRVEFTNPDGSLGHASVVRGATPYAHFPFRVASEELPTFGTLEKVRAALERGDVRSDEATNGEILLLAWRRSRVTPEAVRGVTDLLDDPDERGASDDYLADLLEGDEDAAPRSLVLATTTLLADLASGVPAEWALRRALEGRSS